ncbi:SlyX family protein [Rhodoferax sp.]|uniref:SlyX family protein n=1 Tax=Rhodoferax sp. TaxID=50421 RepID=UPI00275E600F|nr:SlyX family protein [Rhodoferax sp.]
MPHPDNTEQRLIDLEVKASFTEDLVDQLERIIVRQQQQIDALIRQVAELCQPQRNSEGVGRDARDDLPPHY